MFENDDRSGFWILIDLDKNFEPFQDQLYDLINYINHGRWDVWLNCDIYYFKQKKCWALGYKPVFGIKVVNSLFIKTGELKFS